jgi:uncharacterized membrane protein YoaK (UPF0700 family)
VAHQEAEVAQGVRGTSEPTILVVGLLLLTAATGIVDAVCFLGFGHVFVANMTGNVVFIGFSISPESGVSPVLSVVALAGYAVGAATAGVAGTRYGKGPAVVKVVFSAQIVLMVFALIVVALVPGGTGERVMAVAALALALGAQSIAVRFMDVADLSVTVLTMTLARLLSDRPSPTATSRRLLSVVMMAIGAAVGALLMQVELELSLGVAVATVSVSVLIIAVGLRIAPRGPVSREGRPAAQ